MQNIRFRKVWKRSVTLLLLFALLLTALPRGAKAEDVTITSGEGGVASFLPGNGDKTYFTIIATPHSSYVFDYWESTCAADASYNNKRFYGSQLTMPYARSNGHVVNVTFKASFRLKNEPVYGVSVQVESGLAGRGVVSGGKQATDDRTEVTTTITASPHEGYEFVYWTNNDYPTKNFYERSMQVTAPVGYHVIYTAHFDYVENARGAFTAVAGIDANGNRTDGLGGTAVGDAVYSKGGVATQQTALQAIPATNGYAFSHWERKRDAETQPTTFTANPLPVTVENHRDVYTAVFVAQSKASGVFVESGYYENSTWTSGGGTATGGKLYDSAGGAGQQTTLQAFPVSTGWVFQKWEKSNATGWEAAGYSPTIAVPVTDAHTVYRAVFIEAANASGVQTAVRLEGDTAGVVPGSATGDKAYSDSAGAGQQTTMQAFPLSDQYMFSHWERSRDGGAAAQISTANPYAVKVENHKDIYTAVFVKAAEAKGVQTTVRLIGGAAGEGGTATGDQVYSASAGAGQQTTLQAFPSDPSVVFAYWERSRDGGTAAQISSANPYAVKVENHKDVYTAVFRSALDCGVFVSADPMHGTATGAKAYDWNGGIGQQTTLQAFPISNEWEFDHWELIRNGATPAVQVSTANPYTVPVTGAKDEYTAVFRAAGDKGVFVEASPTAGGTATGAKAYNPNGGAGQQTTLQAFPTSKEYVFTHWELSRDGGAAAQVSSSNPYAAKVENHKDVYTAVFRLAQDSGVFVSADPVHGTATGAKAYDWNGGIGQQTTLQAFPASNEWEFDHWELIRNGATPAVQVSTANPYTVPVTGAKDEYTAVFRAAGDKGVFVEASPTAGGTATGAKAYNPNGGAGQQTTLQAFPTSNEYIFTHWELSRDGGAAAQVSSSNPYAVKVENHKDVYTAVFRLAQDSGVFVSADPAHGTATGAKAYDWNGGIGQQTTLQAFPASNEWEFDHWELVRNGATPAVQVSTANPYTVSVTDAKDEYTAVFRAAGDKGVFVEASPTAGGTATGAKAYNPNGGAGQQTTLQAFPTSNEYIFTHWELSRDGGAAAQVSSSNPYAVKVENHKDIYTAVFIKTPNNSPVPVTPDKTGITDGPFLDVWRRFTSPNYGTTRESMEQRAADAVNESSGRLAGASSDTGVSAALERLREALSGKSKKKTKDRSEMSGLPEDVLVTSDGDSYITEDIGMEDDSDFAGELVAKRYGSLYDYEVLQMVHVSGPAQEGGRDTTMVWKGTGAEETDRLLLVRFLPDGTQSIATPVADGDGTLTFTLPAATDSEYLLLRVFLKQDVG